MEKKTKFSREKTGEDETQYKNLKNIESVIDERKLNPSEIQPSQTKVVQRNDREVVNNFKYYV